MTGTDGFPRDILEEIRSERITAQEADQIFDDLIDAIHAGERDGTWRIMLGMTIDEATVRLHGRPWSEALAMREARSGSGAPAADFGSDDAAATKEWDASGEAKRWDATIGDGLDDPVQRTRD